MIEEGRARIDGRRTARPSEPVRVGSVIAMPVRGKVRVIRVLTLPGRRGPANEAPACYEEIDGISAAT